MSGAYDAGCIRVLQPADAREKFGFARAADLAVRRYLDRDRSVPATPELLECHRELLSRLRP